MRGSRNRGKYLGLRGDLEDEANEVLLHDGVAQLMKPTRSSFSMAWLSWGGSEAARRKDDRTGERARREAGDGTRERTGTGCARARRGLVRADGGRVARE